MTTQSIEEAMAHLGFVPLWAVLEGLFEASWAFLGASGAIRKLFVFILGNFGAVFEASWMKFQASWTLLGRLGGHLEPSWANLEPAFAVLEPS